MGKGRLIAILTLLLALAAMLPLASAQNPTGNIWTERDARMSSVVQLLILGLAAGVFAVSVLYMAVHALHSSEYEMYLKGELYEYAVTVVWGIAIFGAAVIVGQALQSYAGGDLFDMANTYISRVNALSVSSVVKLEGVKLFAQYFSGLMSKYYAGAWGFKIPAMPGFEIIERVVDLIQMLITPFSASLMVQQIGLQVIKATALTFMLPAGLLMRLFPPTREAGAFMMATALAFYFVFPFIYVINAIVMGQLYMEEYGYPMGGGNENIGGEWLQDFDFYSGLGWQLAPFSPNDITKTLPLKPDALLSPMRALSYVVMQAVFLPALSMVLVVSFVKTASKFFNQRMEG